MPPKPYQLGYTEFYKLKFKVTPDVLIPRPETEMLVETVLSLTTTPQLPTTIVDVGTGSGCIAISLAKNLPTAKVYGLDISSSALKIAGKNAKLNHVSVNFQQSNLLADFNGSADIIVANLPYIPTRRINQLDSSVKDFEPHLALDGGSDGLRLYEELFEQISKLPALPQAVICEIDEDQGQRAIDLARLYFKESLIETYKDLAKKERILRIVIRG